MSGNNQGDNDFLSMANRTGSSGFGLNSEQGMGLPALILPEVGAGGTGAAPASDNTVSKRNPQKRKAVQIEETLSSLEPIGPTIAKIFLGQIPSSEIESALEEDKGN